MGQGTLFPAEQSLQIQTERSQRANLEHSTTRNAITELILPGELADDVEHGSILAGESVAERSINWGAVFGLT